MSRSDRTPRPSPLATALLRLCTVPGDRAAILGDLEEEYRELAATRPSRAAQHYWSQTLRSVAPLLVWRLCVASRLRAVVGVVAGSATAIVSATLVGTSLERVLGVDAEPAPAVVGSVVMLCVFVSSASAGWISGRVAGSRSPWVLVAVGLVVVAPEAIHAAILSHPVQTSPEYLPLAFALLAAPLGLALGARLGQPQTRGVTSP